MDLLDFYGVPYTLKMGKKPDSDYNKVPVLDIGEHQVPRRERSSAF